MLTEAELAKAAPPAAEQPAPAAQAPDGAQQGNTAPAGANTK
jgi:hypothetical protein